MIGLDIFEKVTAREQRKSERARHAALTDRFLKVPGWKIPTLLELTSRLPTTLPSSVRLGV